MAEVSRREFVHRAAYAGALVGVAQTLPAVCAAPPSERVRVGFVGVAGRAGALLSLFGSQDDVEIVALADIDANHLQAALAKINADSRRQPKAFEDFRFMLDDPSIDAVVVGTPDHWHAIPTILACTADKDVYVEKPDGHNLLEGQRMVEAMQKHQRVVQLGTQSRSSPHFQAAIEFIRSGQLGRVLVAKAWESARQHSLGRPPDGQPPPGVNYDFWLGPAPLRPFNPLRFHGNWRWFFDYGTGDLGNDGVHRLDLARWALAIAVQVETGQQMAPLPRKISALGGKWYFDDAQEWPDTLQVDYEFTVPNGAPRLITYEMRIWAPYQYSGETEGVILYGDQAYIILGNNRWQAVAPNGEVLAAGQGENDGREHVRNFLDCVKSRQTPHADLASVGHPSSVMCHAGNIAWRVDRSLQLNAVTEAFDDDPADALRTRVEYRAPWTLPTV